MPIINNQQQGLALVIVIWILTLLSLMAGSFAMSMRRDISVAAASKDTAQALAVAESGLSYAQFMLMQPDPEQRWQGDGRIYQLSHPQGVIRVQIQAESGKIDLNASSEQQLNALLDSVINDRKGLQQILDVILDWRDADDEPRPHGAEAKQYRQMGLAYTPANKAFQNLEELQMVLGMTEPLFAQLQPYLTVYSGKSEVDLQWASPALLIILNNDLQARHIDNPALKQSVSQLEQEGVENAETLNNNQEFTSESESYTIIVNVQLNDDSWTSLEAVVKQQTDDPSQPLFLVMDWKQTGQGLTLFDDGKDSQVITVQDEFTNNHRP